MHTTIAKIINSVLGLVSSNTLEDIVEIICVDRCVCIYICCYSGFYKLNINEIIGLLVTTLCVRYVECLLI